jgi:hypothetical protein
MTTDDPSGAASPTRERAEAARAAPVTSSRRVNGMVLSTANLYFTSNDEAGAHVFRTAQAANPGQEAELYREPPGNEFGDIVFANVAGGWYGYFFTANSSGDAFIKRVPLTGHRWRPSSPRPCPTSTW